ncbi:MAG: type II secretion system F family protein [Bdellovibrionia bacterium]
MPIFVYTGVDRQGKQVKGELEATNEGEFRMALHAQGVRPKSISLARGGGAAAKFGIKTARGGDLNRVRIPVPIVVLFTRQLQLLISSGIPLVQGLEILIEQSNHPGMRDVLSQLREKVSQGSYLWETMGAYPKAFSNLYVSLIRAGEASGSMDQMLKRLSKYLEDEDRLKRMIKGAMMYPIIVTCIGIGVMVVMLVFVIPKFEEMLKQSGQQLPVVTQFVIDMSHFVQHNFLFLAGGVAGLIYAYKAYVATKEGRTVKDRIVFNSPIFGVLAQKSGVARFCRTLQTLLSSGVNLVDAIDICRNAADNAILEDAIGRIRAEVEGGKTLGAVLLKMDVFPKMAAQMVMVGESTGNLDKSLDKIADFYESDVEVFVGGMTKLIEPIVLVVLGGMVGGLMIAMYMPIFTMAGGAA